MYVVALRVLNLKAHKAVIDKDDVARTNLVRQRLVVKSDTSRRAGDIVRGDDDLVACEE